MGRTRHRSLPIAITKPETNYSSPNNIYGSFSSTLKPAPTPGKDTRKGKKKREFPVLEEELELEKRKMEIREKELELEKNRWDVMMERLLGLREREGNR